MLATWGCTTFPKPTLSLDFLGATSLDSGITFSRGSQATLFDSTGTLVYAKQNLLTYSEDFADATWSKDNATVNGNAAIAPNGTLTADKLITNAAVTNGQTFRSVTLAASTTFTFSCFAKAGEWSWTLLATRGPENLDIGAYFNLSAGTVGTVSAGVTASITPVGDGWYRCVVTRTTGTGATASRQRIYSTNADNTLSTGDGTSGIFIWGAQLNQNPMEGGVTSSLTTYYPTTTAAYYAPRFDYDPSTLQPRGLLIEEARTNSILQSEDFATTWVAANITVTTNSATSPSGTMTADTFDDGTATDVHNVAQAIVTTTGTTYTMSAFLKNVNRQYAILACSGATTSYASAKFDLAAGTLGSTQASGAGWSVVSSSITPVGNGWYRCTLTFVVGNTTGTTFRIGTASDGTTFTASARGLQSYTGTNASIYVWGAQLEAGAFATSYIPTITTALTRNTDAASMTGTNFSSWFNASEGTLYVEASTANASDSFIFADINSGVTTNYIRQSTSASGTVNSFVLQVTGSIVAAPGVTVTLGSSRKMAGAYILNSVQQAVNGTLGTEDTSAAIPAGMSQMNLGSRAGSVNDSQIWIARIAYYPTRLPNTTLQALTA